MKNTFGNAISVTIFGESHGPYIGAVLDGIAPGIKVDDDYIKEALTKRAPYGDISTQRRENDNFSIVSGVFNGFTTGTPITILIPNENTKSKDYSMLLDIPRPGHADYSASVKYHSFQDYRGGGHFSGRITAGLVATGAIVNYALQNKGIRIGTHILNLHGVPDKNLTNQEEAEMLCKKLFPVISEEAEEKMKEEVLIAKKRGDSVGGTLESAIFGVPAGVGEPFFDSLESQLSHILFSIPGIKGVEFGDGFAMADMYGSEANDPFVLQDGEVRTLTNHNGGINGGISNGMPITFKCAVKPTPSIFMDQKSVSLSKNEEVTLSLQGRHDPAIIHRVRAVVDAAAAIALADMLVTRFGTDYLKN
ncbi:MAG: chorismate synthase [Clostridia bacterium]|nr:chorismate synthase [Clostridia bacterium]